MTPARIPDGDLLNDLERVAGELGHTPSAIEYTEHGRYDNKTLIRHFNSWREACREAGLDPNISNQDVVDDPADLLDDLERVAGKLEHTPSQSEYDEYGEYTYMTLINYFNSWREACCEAGLDPNINSRDVVDDPADLLDDLKLVAEKLGYTPPALEYDEHGKYTNQPFRTYFGSWREACREAGLDPNINSRDVVGDPADLLNDVERVAEKLGHPPSPSEYTEHGGHGSRTLARYFDSWKSALGAAGLWPIEYAGVEMRSTYEPTVAQALDDLDVDWEYESGWLETSEGRYLPDFVLDDGTIIEVKGDPRSAGKGPKLEALMDDGRRVVVVGAPNWEGELPCDAFVLYQPGDLTKGLAGVLDG